MFPVRSLRYADPRKALLKGAAWEAARPVICRTVRVAAAGDDELAMLSKRLDLAYRKTAARVPENKAVTIAITDRGADLSVEPLDRIEEPASLTKLRPAVEARLPRVDLPELIMEVHARTGFAASFTHASEGSARAEDIVDDKLVTSDSVIILNLRKCVIVRHQRQSCRLVAGGIAVDVTVKLVANAADESPPTATSKVAASCTQSRRSALQ